MNWLALIHSIDLEEGTIPSLSMDAMWQSWRSNWLPLLIDYPGLLSITYSYWSKILLSCQEESIDVQKHAKLLRKRYQGQSRLSPVSKGQHATTIDGPDYNVATSIPNLSSPCTSSEVATNPPYFVLTNCLEICTHVEGMTELWGDHVAFSDEYDFHSWAQRFLHEQQE